jgi:hypothetical protein
MGAIGVQGVLAVGAPQAPRQRFRRSRNEDQVDVIRHQAIADDVQPLALGVLGEQFKVEAAVSI